MRAAAFGRRLQTPSTLPLPAPRSGGGRGQGLTSVGFSPGRGAGCRFWALTLPPAPSLSRLREREGEKKGILRWRLLATTAKSQSNSPSPLDKGQEERGDTGDEGGGGQENLACLTRAKSGETCTYEGSREEGQYGPTSNRSQVLGEHLRERVEVIMAASTWGNYKETKFSKPLPLKGIRVLEVCTLLLGPSGPGFLARLGAEVIKCEVPPMGDTLRSMAPFSYFFKDQSTSLIRPNPNKYWIGLDLHKPEGQQVFLELAAKADIIEENLRPGVMERWNVGYRQIVEVNPSIIYISKTGFGQWGQYAEENRPSNDGAAQGMSGCAWISSFPGRPPLKNRLYVCDSYGALLGEVAVLAALHYRDRTGKGQYIELSQSEAIMRTMSWVWPYQQITGKGAGPAGNRDVSICPADTFRCVDDTFVAIAAPDEEEFRGLCRAMGRPELADDPRFQDHLTRLQEENATEILRMIAEWARTRTAEEIERLAEEYGFAASRVCSIKDVVESEHSRARGFLAEVDDPLLGEFLDYEFPVMMSRTSPRVRWSVRPVGFDNEYVMRYILGKSEDEVRRLYECGALGKWAQVRGRRPPPEWDGKAGLILSRE